MAAKLRFGLKRTWLRRTAITLGAAGLFTLPVSIPLLTALWTGNQWRFAGLLGFVWLFVNTWIAKVLTRKGLVPPWEAVAFMLLGAELGAGIMGLVVRSWLIFGLLQPLALIGVGFVYFETRKYTLRNTRATRRGLGRWCDGCEYDMKGHEDGDACPECGSMKRFDLDPEMTLEMEKSQSAR